MEGALCVIAEEIRPAVEQLRGAAEVEGKALVLSADVGWATFLKLWRVYNMSLRIEEGGREVLRVEVLEARADGTAKFRLWYYKWRKTKPQQPYIDFEITYQLRGGRIHFFGYIYANKAKGILREHLHEIAQLLKDEGVEGVSLLGNSRALQFTDAFRNSILGRLCITPGLMQAELIAVEHLGGFKFKIDDKEVEFVKRYVKSGYEFYAADKQYEFYAELKLSSAEEAIRFALSLRA